MFKRLSKGQSKCYDTQVFFREPALGLFIWLGML